MPLRQASRPCAVAMTYRKFILLRFGAILVILGSLFLVLERGLWLPL